MVAGRADITSVRAEGFEAGPDLGGHFFGGAIREQAALVDAPDESDL